MRIEVHAGRFEEDDEKRKDKSTAFYSNPAVVQVKPEEEIILRIRDGVIYSTIDGEDQMPMVIGEYEYTAVAITYLDKEDE